MIPSDSGVGRYYDRVEKRHAEAHKRWREAIARGAPPEEIDRLEREMLRAGDTGD